MSQEDLESYESGAQLALYEEYKNVAELFTYIVETDRRFYLANQVQVTPRAADGSLYFEVEMQDVGYFPPVSVCQKREGIFGARCER